MPTNDLRNDEDRRVVTVSNAFRQSRQGRPYDTWEWAACTQDDVDRARELVAHLDDMARRYGYGQPAPAEECPAPAIGGHGPYSHAEQERTPNGL